MPVHQFFATTLLLIKWPLALSALLFLPAVVWAFAIEITQSWQSLSNVFIGMLAYAILWRWQIRLWKVDWLSTLEHEITHCLFAWLTGNRVTGLKVTLQEGGHMTYIGQGNWLIDVAPYFFPTVTVLLILALPFVPQLTGVYGQWAIGVSVAYHATSTWKETHHAQTDLQNAGFLFCWLFLPSANIASLGLTLAAARAGLKGMSDWIQVAWNAPWRPEILLALLR